MRINTIVRFSAAIALALTVGGKAYATDYLITLKAPTVEGQNPNVPLKGYKGAFKHKPFTYLENWWTSWSDLNSNVTLQSGDNVYFGPGVNIGDITIATSGINLYGNNKDCLGWYGTDTDNKSSKTRLDETSVTGRITINSGVSDVTIAGFYFTGAGQVYANGRDNNNIQVLNNVIENINAQPNNTTEREDNYAVFYFGKAYRQDYANAAAYNRYGNITIAHNDFRGQDINNEADWIQVAGSYGNLHIHDNHFLYGGDGVNVFNATGTVNILHNRFDKVGNGKVYAISAEKNATGSFAVRLFYLGLKSSYPVNVYVRHNYFDGCQGQSSKYAIIRFYNENGGGDTPQWAKLYINHNYFLNKTSFVNEKRSDTDGQMLGLGNEVKYDHYYVYYADINTNKAADVDWRFNRFDHSEMEFAYLISPWDRKRLEGTGLLYPGRYYASLSGVFEHTTAEYETGDDKSTGTQCGFYGKQHNDGTYFGGKALVKVYSNKNQSSPKDRDFVGTEYSSATVDGSTYTFRPSKVSTVVQSFDRDDETGDLYFIQVRNKDYGNDAYGVTSTCKKPLILTKWDVKTRTASHMFLDYAGHGSNMCVYRHKDQVYIMLGGNQLSYGEQGVAKDKEGSDPREILIFPFVKDQNINLKANTANGAAYNKIAHKQPSIPIGTTAPNGQKVLSFVYPSIDHSNNLYVERQRTAGGDYFTVYEADDVFECIYNGEGTPKIIGRCYIAAGAEKIGSTSTSGTRPALNTYDKGFKTWDDQGFTIAGDYIYTFEGNGDDDNTHINLHKGVNGNAGDKDGAVQLINCINWRNGTFMYRRNINKHSTYNTANKYPGTKQADGTYKDRKLDGPAQKSAGEPEGIKVFRDHTGRAQLIIGVVGAQSGDRDYNLYAYRQKRTKVGTVIGRELTKDAYNKKLTTKIPDSKLSTGETVLSLESSNLESKSLDFYHSNNGEARNVHATIVGEHAEYFTLTPKTKYYANGTDLSLLPTPNDIDVNGSTNWARPTNRDYSYNAKMTYEKAANTAHTGEHTYQRGYTLTFNPSKYLKEYDKAWVKLSSPGATDVYIPIKATYTGTVTSVENVISDNGELEVEGYYDLTGRRVVNPEGFVIVRYTNGTAEKKFIH